MRILIALIVLAAGAPAAAASCDAGPAAAAAANAATVATLAWAPFGRGETGWQVYYPRVAAELATSCPAGSPGFAAAVAAWQAGHHAAATGRFDAATFAAMKGGWQNERPFVQISARRICPAPPADSALTAATAAEGYGGKIVRLRPAALAAWRKLAAAARAEAPGVAAERRSLTLFSGYRDPAADAARCAKEGNCNGIVRATCSAHRTGLALDAWVGQAPGYGPDSSADPNRLAMVNTPAYRWLLANARRFGFVNYVFEPWHWEWTGEPI